MSDELISDIIPKTGQDPKAILAAMEDMRHHDADWRGGRTWSLVYSAGPAHTDFLKQAHNLFFSENGLNPTAFKSLKRLETDTVAAVGALLNGPSSVVGTLSSGGTESILLAMKTYHDRSKRKKPWVLTPEVIVPVTAHPAFDKAAHYFGIRLRKAPLMEDFRVDVQAVKRLINRNTAAIVGSAPHYPQGVIDPIEELAELAHRRGIPMHVDACVGGMMLPWVEKLGHALPAWDFRVEGVTSISVDLHKYGYAAKGASLILYRDMEYLRDQFFVATDWPGGIYASAYIAGTRPGGPIAAAWATLQKIGEEGYLDLTRKALGVRDKLIAAIEDIPKLAVFGEPAGTLVSFGSTHADLSIFAIADVLEKKGWHFDRHQNPNCIHATCGASNVESVDEFIRDIQEAVAHVETHPELADEGGAAMYGMMAKVPVRGLVKMTVRRVMEAMYAPGAVEPDLENLAASDPLLQKLEQVGGVALKALDSAKGRLAGILGRGA